MRSATEKLRQDGHVTIEIDSDIRVVVRKSSFFIDQGPGRGILIADIKKLKKIHEALGVMIKINKEQ